MFPSPKNTFILGLLCVLLSLACNLLLTNTARPAMDTQQQQPHPSFHSTAIRPFDNYVHLKDRQEGGLLLAQKLQDFKGQADEAIVIGLPRGGVVTGYYVAKELGLPLDVIVARKIGCPFHEELAVGM